MLKQIHKDRLKVLGIDFDKLDAAMKDAAEVDIDIAEGDLFTPATLATRDANTKADGVKEGEKNALPLAITEINKQTGLAIDATKIARFGDLGKALKDELGKTTDEKLKTVNQQVADLLKDKETLTTDVTNYKSKAEKTEFEYNQFKHLPDNRSKANTENEYLMLLGSRGVEVRADGVYRNGELMKVDATKGAMPHADAYKQLFTEFKWIAEPPAGAAGGRGGGNSGGAASGGKATSMSGAQQKWQDANPQGNLISPEANAFLMSEAKDNPSFDWNA